MKGFATEMKKARTVPPYVKILLHSLDYGTVRQKGNKVFFAEKHEVPDLTWACHRCCQRAGGERGACLRLCRRRRGAETEAASPDPSAAAGSPGISGPRY